jgi:NADH-quinone oxidoreductase subunit N
MDALMLHALLPEIGLLVLAALVLVLDVALSPERRAKSLGWVVAAGLVADAIVAVLFARPEAQPQLLWGGMLRLDSTGFVLRLLFLMGAAVATLLAQDDASLAGRGEFFALLLTSTLGMSLLVSSGDWIMLFLALETTSIPLYVMAGFLIEDVRSVESGVKYVLYGVMSSALLLFGISFIYGITGSTSLYDPIAQGRLAAAPLPLIVAILALVLAGFGFKISAVPFHFWAPDVYEGSAAPVAGFLSTTSKAAGFVVLLRVMQAVFPQASSLWTVGLMVLSVASMFFGNLVALTQTNFKRLLAYSSIAQAGYILIGIAVGSPFGATGAIYYLIAYLVTNLAAFALATLTETADASSDISRLAGLSRQNPFLALALLCALLSLAGVPPFGGFVAKVLVFGSAVQAGFPWLALVGAVNAIIALYYYLNVLKVAYLYPAPSEGSRLAVGVPARVALIACVVGILAVGIVFQPWFNAASWAAGSLVVH